MFTGRDVYNGVLGATPSSEKAAVGLTKMAAGAAMLVPGGALVGGVLYAGALVYEHQEALGQALSAGWDKAASWTGL